LIIIGVPCDALKAVLLPGAAMKSTSEERVGPDGKVSTTRGSVFFWSRVLGGVTATHAQEA
jgi:hypothetical protein